jgi:hypothetical protein
MAMPTQIEIPLTLHLSPDAGARLADRAAAAGQDVPQYVATLVESIVESPRTLAEISGQVHERFLASGTSDEELAEELERAKHEMRADRPARNAS